MRGAMPTVPRCSGLAEIVNRQTAPDGARAKLLPKAVDQLAEGFPVHIFHFADHHLGALDGLRLGYQVIQLVQRAFAALIGQLLFQLLGCLD